MGDHGVHLWMPRHLVHADDPQANYLTGYGNGRFYLALSNEAPGARMVTLTLDRDRIPYVPGRPYPARLWRDGKPAGTTTVIDGKVTLPLSSKGLTAIAVDGLPVFTRLQRAYFAAGEQTPADGRGSFRTDTTPVGNVTAMLLGFADQRDLYVWTSASDSDVREAKLTILTPGLARTMTDARHPFEFSLPIGEAKTIDYSVSFVRTDGSIIDGGNHSVQQQ
jgi:hypothetical protein